MADRKLTHDDYLVAWICPLEVEQIDAMEMLDEEHPDLPQPLIDLNVYSLGSINDHKIAIAWLPSAGNNSAATAITKMKNSFRKLRFGLLVGVGGSVPNERDIGMTRLGDVVVSNPEGTHSGAIQYDHGKAEVEDFRRTGFIPPRPHVLLNAAQRMAVKRARSREDPLQRNVARIDTTRQGLSALSPLEGQMISSSSQATCTW